MTIFSVLNRNHHDIKMPRCNDGDIMTPTFIHPFESSSRADVLAKTRPWSTNNKLPTPGGGELSGRSWRMGRSTPSVWPHRRLSTRPGRDGDTMILTFIYRALIQEPMLPKARLALIRITNFSHPGVTRVPAERGRIWTVRVGVSTARGA